MTDSLATVRPQVRDARTKGALAAIALGAIVALAMGVAGLDVTLVPLAIGLAVALMLVPFPAADRLLALSLIGTMPLIWSDPLPNVPLAAGVLVIALVRIAPMERRVIHPRAWIVLAAVWSPLVVGVALAHWPPASVWLRPTALLALGAAAAVLGVLVWRDPERRQRWLEGITLGALLVAVSGLVVFSLQFFMPVAAVVDRFADVQGALRGTSAAETFRVQNNWLIPGEPVTLRAISPLFPSPNNLGAYLGITTPIAFVLSLSHPRRGWRLVAVAATALAVSLVVLTFSRSTWLATVVACALIVGLIALGDRSARPSFGVRGNTLKLTLALALVGLVALYIGAAAGSTTMWDRVLNPLGDESVTDRLNTNADALEAIAASPLRGAGLGNWRAAIEHQEDVAYVHNVYLEYSVAVGIFGGLWAVMVVTVPLVAGAALIRGGPRRNERLLGVVILAVFAFAAVHFMFDDNLLNPQYAWLLSFMFGGSVAAAWAGRSSLAVGHTDVGS
jgi:hypothetical protein